MLHILILNYEYPPLGGGAGIVSKHLAEEFVRCGNKVTVLTTWYAGEPTYVSEKNLTIIRLESKRKKTYQSNPIEMFDWIIKAKKYIKNTLINKNTFAVCLANFALPGGEVALYIKKKYAIPYIILSHGHDIPWAFPKKMFIWHLLTYYKIKKICTQSSYNILLSDEIKKMADKLIDNKEKNVVFFNGLHIDKPKKILHDNTLKIVFVGRLVQQKNPMLFLEILKKLATSNIPYEAKIVGDGELKNKLQEYAIRHKIANIAFCGKVSHAEVLTTLDNSNLLISTSESEGMSMAILEALAAGVYVIASNVSGNDTMIIENTNGHIVLNYNADEFAEKIKDFYFQKLTKKYTYPENYTALLHNQFSWKKIAQQYLQLFYKVMEKP